MAGEIIPAAERLDTLPPGIPERTLGWEALAFAAKYLRHVDGDRAGQRWEFTPRQARFILWYYAVDENGAWEYGHAARRLAKGPIAHSEMVPTPSGWKRHGDLQVWDDVYAVDGSVTKVLELGHEVDEDCYRVSFSDSTIVKCTGSHRWPVDALVGNERVRKIVTVDEMLKSGLAGNELLYRTLPTPLTEEGHSHNSGHRFITAIEPIESEPARCITVGHESHQYLVGDGWVPTCNSGKSPFAAVMAIVEFLAPVRFAGWDDSLPGRCYGKRVDMPLVQLVAASLSQTENTMSMIQAMLSPHNAPQLREDYNLDVGKTQITTDPWGKLEVVSSSPRSVEGARATCVIADELEHWTPSTGGVKLFTTLKANLTKTGNRMIETLNSWEPDVGSAGELTFKAWCGQQDGTERETERGILYDAVMAPFDTDIADKESLTKALEFVYEDCYWSLEHLDAIISDIYTSSTPLAESKRKYLNWNVAAEDAWADPKNWALMADRSRKVADGEDIVMFFDGSLSRDATALVGACVSDGHVFTIGVWEPGNKHSGNNKIDARAVDARVEWAFQRYNVRAFFADVNEWDGYVKNVWAERYADRLDIWATPSAGATGVAEPIAWDMRSKTMAFTMACELVEAEILDGAFTHDGDPILARHVANARRHENRWGIDIRKESKDSSRKIDAAVCMIGARHALRVLRENGGTPATYEAFFY